ncbi:MAG: beta-galactosidase [Planctomycetota bacterium]|nr:beta-galactosidase [Planctomycetota bacterium]
MTLPRPEYPRPQFVRKDWLCLNGAWQFESDPGDSGKERGLLERELKRTIAAPFCPESSLSGIGETDFHHAVWYRRTVRIPAEWKDRRALLHFQAVDYEATVWANGKEVGRHRGGWTPFSVDLSPVASAGQDVTLVVRARDDHRLPKPQGKQSPKPENYGCMYTRTTGIWQTVWMEPVPETHLKRPRILPDLARGLLRITQPLSRNRPGWKVRAILKDAQGVVAEQTAPADTDLQPVLELEIPEARRRLWSISDPHLYDVELELLDASGAVADRASSYAGLRGIAIDGQALKLNGEPVFQRLVLDQGYYPDGILTAPSDAALKRDIELSMAAGFNGARLHQKVFEERFLYHADRMGYLVWGEFGDWCFRGRPWGEANLSDEYKHQPAAAVLAQWMEVLERDLSHPSIVGWCPLNETHEPIRDFMTSLDDVTRGLYAATKLIDPSRPVLDTSGYAHRVDGADVYDSHDYTQDPKVFAERHKGLAAGKPFVNTHGDKEESLPYRGQPYFVSEFGGIWWNPDAKEGEASWGYGERPKSLEEFLTRFEGLCEVLLGNPHMFGYCYTQLTDVYQEQNGIFRFDRSEKFALERVRAAQRKAAAIEQGQAVRA